MIQNSRVPDHGILFQETTLLFVSHTVDTELSRLFFLNRVEKNDKSLHYR